MASWYQMLETQAGRRPANLYECRDKELPGSAHKKPAEQPSPQPQAPAGGAQQ